MQYSWSKKSAGGNRFGFLRRCLASFRDGKRQMLDDLFQIAGGQIRAIQADVRLYGRAACPDGIAVCGDQKFTAVCRRVLVRFFKRAVHDIGRRQVPGRVIHDLKSYPALPVICAIGRPEEFVGEVSIRVPDDKCLIVRDDRFIVFRQPRQIEADLPGQHGQKIGRILRHILHFLCAILRARDTADAHG